MLCCVGESASIRVLCNLRTRPVGIIGTGNAQQNEATAAMLRHPWNLWVGFYNNMNMVDLYAVVHATLVSQIQRNMATALFLSFL